MTAGGSGSRNGRPAGPKMAGPETAGSAMAGPAIDRSVLGEWLAGDEAAIDELLVVFRDSVRAEQARLTETLAAGDLEEYAQAAHRLKGAAASMGARMLANAAGVLYTAARNQNWDVCAAGMEVLETQVGLMAAEVPPAAVTSGGTSSGG
jgi:HPt (histidine-containing phosphotransfer) domain-containing protein